MMMMMMRGHVSTFIPSVDTWGAGGGHVPTPRSSLLGAELQGAELQAYFWVEDLLNKDAV